MTDNLSELRKSWKIVLFLPLLVGLLTFAICESFLPKTYLYEYHVQTARAFSPTTGVDEYPEHLRMCSYARSKKGRFAGNPSPALVDLDDDSDGLILEIEAADRGLADGYAQRLVADLSSHFRIPEVLELSKAHLSGSHQSWQEIQKTLAQLRARPARDANSALISQLAEYQLSVSRPFVDETQYQEILARLRPLSLRFVDSSRSAYFPPIRVISFTAFLMTLFLICGRLYYREPR